MGKKKSFRKKKKPAPSNFVPGNFRELAFVILKNYFLKGIYLSDSLDEQTRKGNFERSVIRQTQELAYGTLRRSGTLRHLLSKKLSRPWDEVETELQILLQIGCYQILYMDSVPDHAAVHETVELAKRLNKKHWVRFLNGILRNVTRMISPEQGCSPSESVLPVNRDRLIPFNENVFPNPETDPVGYFSAAYSFPLWISERWAKRYSAEELFSLGNWFNSVQPITLRINRLKTNREKYLELLTERGIEAAPGEVPNSVVLGSSVSIRELPGYEEGLFMVQDQTAMQASLLLNPTEGEQVLDLCAAPGTKTGQIAELMNDKGSILACDISQKRLKQIEENMDRFGYSNIKTRLISREGFNFTSEIFDAILIDAPCSNTGVLGKRPEARWRIQETDIQELKEIQKQLLLQASEFLTQAGRIVYSTCSIEPEENEELIKWFLQEKSGFKLISEKLFLPGRPDDGGYQALLKKEDHG